MVPVNLMNIIDTSSKLLYFTHFSREVPYQLKSTYFAKKHREATCVVKANEQIAHTLLVFLCIAPYIIIVDSL